MQIFCCYARTSFHLIQSLLSSARRELYTIDQQVFPLLICVEKASTDSNAAGFSQILLNCGTFLINDYFNFAGFVCFFVFLNYLNMSSIWRGYLTLIKHTMPSKLALHLNIHIFINTSNFLLATYSNKFL